MLATWTGAGADVSGAAGGVLAARVAGAVTVAVVVDEPGVNWATPCSRGCMA